MCLSGLKKKSRVGTGVFLKRKETRARLGRIEVGGAANSKWKMDCGSAWTLKMLQMWLERVDWDDLVTWRDERDWVSACRNIVVPGNAGKCRPETRWRDVLEDDLKKGRIDRSLAKDRDRWRAQIMGKASDLCEQQRDVKCEERLVKYAQSDLVSKYSLYIYQYFMFANLVDQAIMK